MAITYAASAQGQLFLTHRWSAAAGAHTVTVRCHRSSGGGSGNSEVTVRSLTGVITN